MRQDEVKSRFQFLGEGICRAVYGIDEYFVAKFATCLDGFDQNSMENRIYKNEGRRYIRYLCPVIWHRPGMLVMLRAVQMTKISPNAVFDINTVSREAYRDLSSLSKKYNLLFEDILSASSWGILDGRPVLIDYGCTN